MELVLTKHQVIFKEFMQLLLYYWLFWLLIDQLS